MWMYNVCKAHMRSEREIKYILFPLDDPISGLTIMITIYLVSLLVIFAMARHVHWRRIR